MSDPTESAPPKLFEHCLTVFSTMRSRAVSVTITDGGLDRHALVYEGHMTKLFQELELPSPYYTSILGRLRSMGCIIQLSRGGGGSPSRWELLADPELDEFLAAEKIKRAQPTRMSQAEGDIRALGRRVGNLERQLSMMQSGLSEGEESD